MGGIKPFILAQLDWAGDVLPCPRPRLVGGRKAYLSPPYLRQKMQMAALFRCQAMAQGCPFPVPFPVLVVQRFSGKLHRGRDLDNLAKGVNDALVDAGILKSDNLQHLRGLFALFDWGNQSPGLRVQVLETGETGDQNLVNFLRDFL